MFTLTNKEIPFMKYRGIVLLFSIVIVTACAYLLFTKGLNYGTDFKGGLKFIYEFTTTTSEQELTQTINPLEIPGMVVQRFGKVKDNTFLIKSDVPEGRTENFSQPFTKVLNEKFGAENIKLIKEEFVGPKVGKELRKKGIYAVLWAWIIMLVYIGFRFDFYFAPGAILALIHDLMIALGAFALSGREVNLTVVAAFLTIVGYSINDTIVIFDRIRENIKKYKGSSLISILNRSLTQTLMRTIVTSLTLFFVVIVLFIRAEGDIQNFAFAMIWGVLAGTYSSIFIATPVFLFLREHGHKFGFKKSAQVS